MTSSGITSGATQSIPLPDPQRLITANDDNGESYFSAAEPSALAVGQDLGGAKMRLAYTSDPPKAVLTEGRDLQQYQAALKAPPPLVRTDGGINMWIIDTPPGTKSPLHRTVSLDYVIQVAGVIELTMSNGDTRTLRPGDVVIQRGTLHAWANPSNTEWSRLVGVMAEIKPEVVENAGELQADFRAA